MEQFNTLIEFSSSCLRPRSHPSQGCSVRTGGRASPQPAYPVLSRAEPLASLSPPVAERLRCH